MPTSFDLVTLDAIDSVVLAQFWCDALGLVVTETEDNDRWIVLGSTSQPRRIGIQRIRGLSVREPAIEGERKARIHLDLACDPDEFFNEVERLIALGAQQVRELRVESYGSIATMADPEGNVFDVCAYRHRG